MRIFFLMLSILMTSISSQAAPSVLDYPSAWNCSNTKFYWYCKIDEENQNPENNKDQEGDNFTQKTLEDQALERLEKLQNELKAKRALAILEPTPENVAAYIEIQNQVTQMAATFSDTWRRVIWQNPSLNYQLKRPVNNAAIDVYNKVRFEAQLKTVEAISKEWGIFFIFRSDCPYCHRMGPTMRYVMENYGITVFPVSVDGGGLPDFPNPNMDNGMTQMLGITEVPMLILANVKDRRMIPLGAGVISVQDLIERIYVLTSTKPGDLY